eukprot:5649418-Pyramimonas_sp.AAC.1
MKGGGREARGAGAPGANEARGRGGWPDSFNHSLPEIKLFNTECPEETPHAQTRPDNSRRDG